MPISTETLTQKPRRKRLISRMVNNTRAAMARYCSAPNSLAALPPPAQLSATGNSDRPMAVITVPVTSGGKKCTIRDIKGAISMPKKPAAMVAPKIPGRPIPGEPAMATMLPTAAKLAPIITGMRMPMGPIPSDCTRVAIPATSRSAVIRKATSSRDRPTASPMIKGTATAPPYISSTCWKLTRIICSKGRRWSTAATAADVEFSWFMQYLRRFYFFKSLVLRKADARLEPALRIAGISGHLDAAAGACLQPRGRGMLRIKKCRARVWARHSGGSVELCALVDPGSDQVTFVLGHLSDIAQRHDLRGDALCVDLRRLGLDLRRCVEDEAGRRCTEHRAAWRGRVAHAATFLNHAVDLGEVASASCSFSRGTGLSRLGRLGRLRVATDASGRYWDIFDHGGLGGVGRYRLHLRAGDKRQADHAQGGGRQGPDIFAAVMAGVEVVAHQYRQHRDTRQNQPVVLAAVGAREVVADHDEQHRQGEVVVVARTQQAFGRQGRVRRGVVFDGLNQRALGRHDGEEHVADHDGANDRADMDIGRATAENLAEAIGGGNDQHEQHGTEQGRALAQRRIAEEVIGHVARDHRAETDGNGHFRCQINTRLDQVQTRVEVVDHQHQRHARQPGGIGLPFEPMQVLRHFRRGQFVFFQVVDTATVNRPEVTRQTFAGIAAVKVVFQPDEIEGCADPGDAGDHMDPANAQVQPLSKMRFHNQYLFPSAGTPVLGFSYWWGARSSCSSSVKKCSSQLLPEPLRSTTRKSSRFSIVSTGWFQTPRKAGWLPGG